MEEIQAEWFAARLKELREGAGFDQKQLAEQSGVSLGSIRDMEQGRTHPTWPRLLALCRALGVECTAFTTPPAEREPQGRGRPAKKGEEPPAGKKKQRGRPRKGEQ